MFGANIITRANIGLLFILLATHQGIADERESFDDFAIEKTVPIQPTLTGQFALAVNLGQLPTDSKGSVQLRLVNEDQTRFSVEGLHVGCNCTTASLSTDNIDVDDTADLEIKLTTPLTSKTIEKAVRVTLVSRASPSRNIHIVLRYQLSGLMCFKEKMVMHKVVSTKDRQQFSVPLLISEPVQAKEIELSFEPPTDAMVATIRPLNKGHEVHVTVDPIFVTEEGLSVKLRARAGELSDSVFVNLMSIPEFQVTPSTIRFRRVDPESAWTASAILRTHTPGESKTNDQTPFLEAHLGEVPLELDATKLSSGIFRVKMRLTEETVDSEKPEEFLRNPVILWRAVSGSAVGQWESKAYFDSSSEVLQKTKNGATDGS